MPIAYLFSTKSLVFVTEKQCVFGEVTDEFMNIIQIYFRIKLFIPLILSSYVEDAVQLYRVIGKEIIVKKGTSIQLRNNVDDNTTFSIKWDHFTSACISLIFK